MQERKIDFREVDINLLRKNGFNSNQVDPLNEGKIRASIERNGMFKPIIVREVPGVPGYEIIGGEHRWEQAKELGHKTVPIANLGEISEAKAKEIGVIDNARYGADDALLFSEILKDIGSIEEIQEFLPYGDADLSAIFSISDIALPELEMPGAAEETAVSEEKSERVAKTHQIMRFKISIGDAERVMALVARTQRIHGFTTADDLTNAGDALVYLLSDRFAEITPAEVEDPEEMLAAIEAERSADE